MVDRPPKDQRRQEPGYLSGGPASLAVAFRADELRRFIQEGTGTTMSVHLQRQLEHLKKQVLSLCVLAEEQVEMAIQALVERDGELAGKIAFKNEAVESTLLQLEAQGVVLRGHFRNASGEIEWCNRRILARIHRVTLGRLRREIEPVTARDFERFLHD